LDFEGISVTLLNFHTYPLGFSTPERVRDNFRYREAQAQALADFTRMMSGPMIVGGDANATHLSDMYKTVIHSSLRDAWWEAGYGFGHTYPGSNIPGSSRLRIGAWFIPQWLARIDYVFISPHWQVGDASLAQFDGVSDHRGVVVELFSPSGSGPTQGK
jgi:endonuclease/exonuclease/phosphatase (EEP) superfamily protein YafD